MATSKFFILCCFFLKSKQAINYSKNDTKHESENRIEYSTPSIFGHESSESCNSISYSDPNSDLENVQKETLPKQPQGTNFQGSSYKNISSCSHSGYMGDLEQSYNDHLLLLTGKRRIKGYFYHLTAVNVFPTPSGLKSNKRRQYPTSDAQSVPLDLSKKNTTINKIDIKLRKLEDVSTSDMDISSSYAYDLKVFEEPHAKKYYPEASEKKETATAKNLDLKKDPFGKLFLQQEILKFSVENNNEITKFYSYLIEIENFEALSINYLINCINRCNKGLKRHSNFIRNGNFAFVEFYAVMFKKYPNKTNIDEENYLSFVKQDFEDFLEWIDTNYNIQGVEDVYNCTKLHDKYSTNLLNNNIHESKNLLDFYKNILEKDRYKILFELVPGLNLILKFKDTSFPRIQIIKIIRYLQLIILRFEVFEFLDLENRQIGENNIENKSLNKDFNEIIAVISIFSKKMLKLCECNEDLLQILEQFSCILFLKAKHEEVFIEYNLDNETKNMKEFKEKDFKFINNFLNISDTNFMKEVQSSKFFNLFKNTKSKKTKKSD